MANKTSRGHNCLWNVFINGVKLLDNGHLLLYTSGHERVQTHYQLSPC